MRVVNPRVWTSTRNKSLKKLRAAGKSLADIAMTLGFSIDAINAQIRFLALPRRSQFRWTPEADTRLAAYYHKPKSEREQMKVELRSWPESPTPGAAYIRASQLKLTKNTTAAVGE